MNCRYSERERLPSWPPPPDASRFHSDFAREFLQRDSIVQQFRNVLVGLDFTGSEQLEVLEPNRSSQVALAEATWLARQTNARLTLFSVLETPSDAVELLAERDPPAPYQMSAAGTSALESLAEPLRDEGLEVECRFASGRPWIEIIRDVLRFDQDLVVVGTRERTRLSQLLFGSTAIKLLRNCPCPVWVTKPETDKEVLDVLVATDLSPVGEKCLQLAINGGQLLDARFHVLHSIEHYADLRLEYGDLPDEEVTRRMANRVVQAENKIHEQLSFTDYRTLTWGVKVHVVDGRPDVAILDAIQSHDIDLLVMGTVARTGVPGVLVGNTAERLLPELTCSVLAIKPDGFQCPITPADS